MRSLYITVICEGKNKQNHSKLQGNKTDKNSEL